MSARPRGFDQVQTCYGQEGGSIFRNFVRTSSMDDRGSNINTLFV